MSAYAELHCLSNFTFLRGASRPEELVDRAHQLEYTALALTDECSVAGVVRARTRLRQLGYPLKLIVGAEFCLVCGLRFVALATDRRAYASLCRLITRGRRASAKGGYRLERPDVAGALEGCIVLWLPRFPADETEGRWLREQFEDRLWIAVELLLGGADERKLAMLTRIGHSLGVPLVASGDVHMHVRSRRKLQDAITAIRLNVPLAETGMRLYPNGERHLREPVRLAKLYPPQLLAETLRIAERCVFELGELRYEYPRELVPAGESPTSHLRKLTEEGASRRWPEGIPAKARKAIEEELSLIRQLSYETYFLTVQDIVREAQHRHILCQGRGSAANSVVCYCLGVTAVNPMRENVSLLFGRFISQDRGEPPDIDIDFEHERREEIIQYIYGKYGRERCALAATVVSYRPRSALRDLSKALGFDAQQAAQLTGALQWWDDLNELDRRTHELGFDPAQPAVREVLELTQQLVGFPRHLSQHVGGFVIAEGLLEELVPIENAAMADRTVVQWDKDDLNELGLIKVDVLGLGMLSALRRAFALVNDHRGWDHHVRGGLALGRLPEEDPEVYGMIQRADTIGVFQVESRAQMSMLPRLKPKTFYDLVIEVAIVRPGPIQGGMVHPYLKRRAGLEPIDYPHEDIREVLSRTLGVPIFQEQVMQIAMVAAGFTAGEADALRRAMGAWERGGDLSGFEPKLIAGMVSRGYEEPFARRLFQQIRGFGEYGFPECVVAETRITDADTGRWITIGDALAGRARLDSTWACDEHFKLRKRRVLAIKASGTKPVWRLRTALGHTIAATAEHPLRVLNGWRPLGELKTGDYVAAARHLPMRGKRRWPLHEVLVLADLIAEGSKQLPEEVFELPGRQLARLLARLWEGDGGFSPRGHADYDTSSQELGRQVQHLLLRIGIVSRLYRRERAYRGHLLNHYVVTVTGEAALRTFWKRVGRHLLDPKKRAYCRSLARLRSNRMSRDILPSLASPDIHWDKVVSIEPLGPRPTYDLEIEGDHNFLADHLVVHNSHAASFALLVYDSAWLKRHEPAAFTCALLNSQPMGFYAPAQLVRDARDHGVEVRPVRVESSDYYCTLERRADGEPALRLGLCLVKSLSEAAARRIPKARETGAFVSAQDLAVRAALHRGDLEALAAAGALATLSGHRHKAFWDVAGTEKPLPLAPVRLETNEEFEGVPLLHAPTPWETVLADYRSLGLTLGTHPMKLLRDELEEGEWSCAADLAHLPSGVAVSIAGIVLMRQHPGSAKGVTFITVEDETGPVNIIVWPKLGDRERRPLVESRLLEVRGQLQHENGVTHLIAHHLVDRTSLLKELLTRSRDFH